MLVVRLLLFIRPIGFVRLILEEPVRDRARVLTWKIRGDLHRDHCCGEDLPLSRSQGMPKRPLSRHKAYGPSC